MSSTRWAFNVSKWEPSKQEFLLASSCLQIEEKNRLDKFVFKKDVKATLAGRLMIRKFIFQNTGRPYNSIIISRESNNKPVYKMSDTCTVSFNVSHHGSFTVLAGEVGNQRVGIDVMQLEYHRKTSIKEYFKTMNKIFSESEWQKIHDSPNQKKIAIFYRNWALKESYLKAIGKGLTVDLRSLNFQVNSELQDNTVISNSYLYINNQKQNWRFEESLIDPSHCVVVALENNTYVDKRLASNLIFKELNAVELLENVVPLLPCDIEYCKRYFSKNP